MRHNIVFWHINLPHGSCCISLSFYFPGLSEVIGGMGEDKLKKLMGDIIQTAERSDVMPHVRDGYIMTYIYLPSVFGPTFVQYVGPILPSILQVNNLYLQFFFNMRFDVAHPPSHHQFLLNVLYNILSNQEYSVSALFSIADVVYR